ncbi:hypothetical protein [Geodermatophilus sp. URMC 64]
MELGATAPTRGLYLIDKVWDDPAQLDPWLAVAKPQIDAARTIGRADSAGGTAQAFSRCSSVTTRPARSTSATGSRACIAAGMADRHRQLPREVDQSTAAALVDELAADPEVWGLLLQRPTHRPVRERDL